MQYNYPENINKGINPIDLVNNNLKPSIEKIIDFSVLLKDIAKDNKNQDILNYINTIKKEAEHARKIINKFQYYFKPLK